jgi:hypothetical protein
MSTLLDFALTYAAKGWQVFPCQPGGKKPIMTPHGCLDATTDRGRITSWWQREPNANIALATGAISNVMVLDVDSEDAEAELRKLEAAHGELPASVEAITGKGRHVYFRYPRRGIRNSASRIAPGIDIRGNGGYVVVPPSLHPSGRRYAWSVDSAGAFANAPEWLLGMLDGPKAIEGDAVPDYGGLIAAGLPDGTRNDTLTRIVGHLLSRGVDPEIAREIALAIGEARCRPPMPRSEVLTIVNSIAGRELEKRKAL